MLRNIYSKASSGISNQIFSTPTSQSTKVKEDFKVKEEKKPKDETKTIVDNFSKILSQYDPGESFSRLFFG